MELPGANYLYALATVSVTFVDFSALLLVFRETIGGRMTGYDSYFTLSFMQAGFIVAAGGLLPQLLAFYEMSHTSVWRASSLIMAFPIFLFVAKIPGRRRAATKESIPFYVGFLLLFQFLAGAYLVLNAIGWPAPPQLAPFALALTVLLFTTGIAVSDCARACPARRPWSNIAQATTSVSLDMQIAHRATNPGQRTLPSASAGSAC